MFALVIINQAIFLQANKYQSLYLSLKALLNSALGFIL